MAESQNSQEECRNKQPTLFLGDNAWCGSYWAEDDKQDAGPTYIVIGRRAPDDKLQKVALRYGYTVEQLQAFRDAPAL